MSDWWTEEQEKRYLVQEWGVVPDLNHPDIRCLLDYVKPKTKVLELGCNSGLVLEHLRTQYKCRVRGIDLPSLKHKSTKIYIYGWDLNQGLPSGELRKEYYGLIFGFSFLEHLYNDWQVLVDVAYSLKKEGIFILSIPGKPDIVPQHIRFYPEPEFERLMRVAGFRVIEKRKHPDYPDQQNRIFVMVKHDV